MRIVLISWVIIALNGSGLANETSLPGVVRILVQSSPLAGSQYYLLDALQAKIQVGTPLELVREPENHHDRNAIRVRWQGNQLGYIPRKENRAIASAIDRGEAVRATVERITTDSDPWKRLRISVYIEL